MKQQTIVLIAILVIASMSGCITETESNKNDNTNPTDQEHNDQQNKTLNAGWYLKEIRDYDEKINSTNDYYSYDLIYARNNITTVVHGGDGQEVRVRTTWETPPEFIMANEEISIYVMKKGLILNHGGLGLYDTSSIVIDFPDMELGYASSSVYRLSNQTYGEFFNMGYGDEPGSVKEARFTGDAPGPNGFNGNFSITFTCKNGPSYGTEYVYEWRE